MTNEEWNYFSMLLGKEIISKADALERLNGVIAELQKQVEELKKKDEAVSGDKVSDN